jgi:hypothetical protein
VKIIGQPHAALHVYLLCQLGPMRWSKTIASPNNTTIASALGSPITGFVTTSLASIPKSDHLFLRPCSVRSVASGASGASNDKGQRPTSLVRLSQHGTTTNPMWITSRTVMEVALRSITSLKISTYMMKTIVIRTSLGRVKGATVMMSRVR